MSQQQSSFYGWKLLAVYWIILFSNFGFPLYGAPVVNTYMAEAFHWHRTQLGLAYSIYQLMLGLPAPLISILIARRGTRFATALGCSTLVAGALLMSFVVHTAWQTYIFYSVVMGLGATTGGILVGQTAVNRWFTRFKGLTITIVHTAITFGGFVAAKLLDTVIHSTGGNWRAGWWLMAALSAVSALLAIAFVRERPSDLGQFPDGATAEQAAAFAARAEKIARVHKTNEEWTLRDALRTPAMWLILFSAIGFSAGFPVFLAHGNAHLRDLGYTPAQAASSFSIVVLSSLIGTLFFAAISDLIEPRLVWAVASVFFAVGLMMALNPAGPFGLYAYAIVLGTSYGICFSAMMVLPANYYGLKGYPPVFALMMVTGTIAAASAATLAGVIFDHRQTYSPVFYACAALSLLAFIALLLTKPARKAAPHREVV
jgi:OFA family oxalate/formate antiporter-like MFS transporter